jgi:hypothetical protein
MFEMKVTVVRKKQPTSCVGSQIFIIVYVSYKNCEMNIQNHISCAYMFLSGMSS